MTPLFEVGDRTLATDTLLTLLTQYQLLPQLLKELIIDREIQDISLTPEEEMLAIEQFYAQHQLIDETKREAWRNYHRMSLEQVSLQALRQFKLIKFKSLRWGNVTEADFLKHKYQLDRFIYSLICVSNAELAQELYFRIKEGESTFSELASLYSEGSEAKTGGRIGPITTATLHPALVQILCSSRPGQLCPPQRLGGKSIIVCLEQHIAAQLNNTVRYRFIEHRYQEWLNHQLQNMNLSFMRNDIS
jgi:parvulin-like peptidyl-prolyl isomerase